MPNQLDPAINLVNVMGQPLASCCFEPVTGYYRNGFCHTGPHDHGSHTVCVEITDEFLNYSASVGNDLSTPAPDYGFSGLKAGNFWCLCAIRWQQALVDGFAPRVKLAACHISCLQILSIDDLKAYAI